MKTLKQFVCLAAIVLAPFSRADTVVVPNDRENLEGNGLGWAGSTPTDAQSLFTSRNFNGPMRITGVAFRLDAASGGFTYDAVIPRVTIDLSTYSGTINTFGLFYAQNRGPDERTVYDGSVTWQSQDLPGGGPNPFDLVITFTQPFDYYPSAGSLLMRLVAPEIGSSMTADGHNHGDASIGWTATESFRPTLGHQVMRFEFSPIPEPLPAHVLFWGSLLLIASGKRRRA